MGGVGRCDGVGWGRVLEHVPAWALAGLWGCSRSQCSGWAVWGRQAHRYSLPKIERGGACSAYFTWKGTVAFQRAIKASVVLGMQQKLPAQALAGSWGTASSWWQLLTAHPFGCSAGSRRWSWERWPGRLRSPILSAPALGWHSCLTGTVLPPWEFAGHLRPWFAGMMRYLSSQVSVAWERVNGNAKLFILKWCRHLDGALVSDNWKMCPLLFNFLLSLLQLTEYKEGNLQTHYLM